MNVWETHPCISPASWSLQKKTGLLFSQQRNYQWHGQLSDIDRETRSHADRQAVVPLSASLSISASSTVCSLATALRCWYPWKRWYQTSPSQPEMHWMQGNSREKKNFSYISFHHKHQVNINRMEQRSTGPRFPEASLANVDREVHRTSVVEFSPRFPKASLLTSVVKTLVANDASRGTRRALRASLV